MKRNLHSRIKSPSKFRTNLNTRYIDYIQYGGLMQSKRAGPNNPNCIRWSWTVTFVTYYEYKSYIPEIRGCRAPSRLLSYQYLTIRSSPGYCDLTLQIHQSHLPEGAFEGIDCDRTKARIDWATGSLFRKIRKRTDQLVPPQIFRIVYSYWVYVRVQVYTDCVVTSY